MRGRLALCALAALGAPGCATGPAPASLPDLSLLALAAPASEAALDAPAPSEWRTLVAAPATALAIAPASPAPVFGVGGLWISHLSLLGGGRWLNKDDWSPLQHQQVFGLEIDESYAETGSGYEAGALYAHDEDDLESTTYEFYGGYRYTFDAAAQEGLHPFISLGAALSHAELDAGETDDDIVLGAYLRAGVLWDVAERVRVGLDYRRLFAEDYGFDLGGSHVNADADYDQLTLSLGFEF